MEVVPRRNRLVLLLAVIFIVLSAIRTVPSAAEAVWHFGTAVSVRRHYYRWLTAESRYFHLRYTSDDSALADWVSREADAVVRKVADKLPHDADASKLWLVLVPDQKTLQEAFGWGEETRALGVYISSTIKILSPRAWYWVDREERFSLFTRQGPLVHEYTHYVLDLRAGGNYPRWFSEGLAQLMEYHILGYEWLEAGSSLENPLFTLDQLDSSFEVLGNEALAYRQALSLVSYMESLQGMEGLNVFLDQLGRGTPFYRAITEVYALDRDEFIRQWQAWHSGDNRWFRTG